MVFRNIIFSNLRFRHYSSLTRSLQSNIDWNYFSNPSNFSEIALNILSRKVHCELQDVLQQLQELHDTNNDSDRQIIRQKLAHILTWFPNAIHPRVLLNKSGEAVVLEKVGIKVPFAYFPASFDSLTKRLNLLRRKNLGQMCGSKSYFLKNDLAILEQALISYTVNKLKSKSFQLMSVPDILSKECFEACGMKTESKHSQVYHIDEGWSPNLCLSGTSEMALASYLSDKNFSIENLPLKLCAVSRCFRSEANKHQKERGIFRVHYFTKVEMFAITHNESNEESEDLLNEFITIQREIFSELGLHFKILEMPPSELGLPAYHKIDMEAWIPSQKIYGEISSASNCTDYQCRRLNIKYTDEKGNSKFCHSLNGTACAIPRLLIAILENFQNLDGSIQVPIPLRKYMKKDAITEKFKENILCTRPIP